MPDSVETPAPVKTKSLSTPEIMFTNSFINFVGGGVNKGTNRLDMVLIYFSCKRVLISSIDDKTFDLNAIEQISFYFYPTNNITILTDENQQCIIH